MLVESDPVAAYVGGKVSSIAVLGADTRLENGENVCVVVAGTYDDVASSCGVSVQAIAVPSAPREPPSAPVECGFTTISGEGSEVSSVCAVRGLAWLAGGRDGTVSLMRISEDAIRVALDEGTVLGGGVERVSQLPIGSPSASPGHSVSRVLWGEFGAACHAGGSVSTLALAGAGVSVVGTFDAEPSGLRGAAIAGPASIVTCGARGVVRLWDVRSAGRGQGSGASLSFELPSAADSAQVVSCQVHPTQPHFVAVGDAGGALHIWDMRRGDAPRGSYQSHGSMVTSIAFYESSPSNLVTCSADGTALWWGFDNAMTSSAAYRMQSVSEFGSHGFGKGDFELLEVHAEVLPVNDVAMDPRTSMLVTGSDAEAVIARKVHLA